MSDARARVFAKINDALTNGRKDGWLPPAEAQAPLPEDLVRQMKPADADTLWAAFAERVARLSDTAHRLQNAEAAREWLIAEAQRRDWKTGVADADALAYLGWAAGEQRGGLTLNRAGAKDEAFACDFGLTTAECAIAETGTLALCTSADRARLASLAPPVHIALVRGDQIVPDVLDALNQMKLNTESGWTWITGSSRTADIDGVLIQGAHGPAELVVLGIF